jgi:hypothetical protein
MKTIILATFVALALVGAACGGGKGVARKPLGFSDSEWATEVARATIVQARPTAGTPEAKATAMAQAIWLTDLGDMLCKSAPPSGCSERRAVLRPSIVLKEYARLIGDIEAEARAEALYEETAAAYDAAHVPPAQPIIIVRPPPFPPPPDDFFERSKLNKLCQEAEALAGQSVC